MESFACRHPVLRLAFASLAASCNDGRSRGRCLFLRRHKPGSGQLLVQSPSLRSLGAVVKAEVKSQGELSVDSLTTTVTSNDDENDSRIEELVGEIKEIFHLMNDGETSPSAYDTAWIAMIPSTDNKKRPQFPTTLEWVLKNQNEDGSWGEPSFFLLYDRLVCTLACVLALKTWATGEDHVGRGVQFLSTHVQQLGKESSSLRTVGFEIVFPSMLNTAKDLGIDLPYDIPFLKKICKMREKKISRIPLETMHTIPTTLAHSLEGLQEVVNWEKILNVQSRDGSLISSPSATAVVYMKTGDKKCLEYLTCIVRKFGDHAACQYPMDIYERLWAVDTIQRLGIDHYFHKEVSDTLDYVYSHVEKQGISWGRDNPVPDIDDTCMALRLLRLHGYPISSDILQHFKDNEGNFVCFPGQTHKGVSDMFNLYRCSQVSFPGEQILEEAKAFAEPYIRNCLQNNQVDDKWTLKKALNKEIDRAIQYPWKRSLQRVEVREYINYYGEDDVWIGKTVYWMYNINNPKYLELAKLDYNRLQTIHRRESNFILKWWKHSGFIDSFTGVNPQEIHFSIAATIYEQEFSDCRIAYTKCICIENVIKNIFESHESISDLRLMCQAVEQWNPALVNLLPHVVKVAFMGMYHSLNDLAIEASNAQGKDMFSYLHGIRLVHIQEYMKKREESNNQNVSSLEEYLEHYKKDVGVAIRVLPAMFLMGNHLEDHVLRCLDQRSKIYDQLSLFLRLLVDVYTYKDMVGKETPNAVNCFMNEENCTEEEAVGHLKGVIDDTFSELVHEYLKPSHVPHYCRRLMFEHARIAQFFLTDYLDSKWTRSEIIRNAKDCLFTPVSY